MSGGRGFFVDMLALPAAYRWLAALPAIFLAMLFFLDQNITVRTVNSPAHKLKKGAAYHLDLFALGLLTGAASLMGLPWMCSATVQSLNHIRAMSIYTKSTSPDGAVLELPEKVIETRVTGFGVHAAILASALFIPVLKSVPLAVVSGVFLYLGKKVMSGNQFLRRCKTVFLESESLDAGLEGEKEQLILGRMAVARFTGVQVLCLAALWALKLNPATALIFPSLIAVLMIIRVKLIPQHFSPRELTLLDTPIGATRA
uniref:Bicarbonate transporter-like transmembrane domain-containing protein n=1 Tax=Haptolina ericina TaxID=156174 RepID=A0A7S3B5Q5_9EUKA